MRFLPYISWVLDTLDRYSVAQNGNGTVYSWRGGGKGKGTGRARREGGPSHLQTKTTRNDGLICLHPFPSNTLIILFFFRLKSAGDLHCKEKWWTRCVAQLTASKIYFYAQGSPPPPKMSAVNDGAATVNLQHTKRGVVHVMRESCQC